MKIDRVIFASNTNSNYIQFWPLVARVWRHTTGARPTLFFVAAPGTPIEHIPNTDIVYIPPPNDLPSCFVAQCIRLLAPLWFPNEVCVLCDIDLLMVSSTFFPQYLANVGRNDLAIINRYTGNVKHNSLCYHVGLGSTFAKVFRLPPTVPAWSRILKKWYAERNGRWNTDERVLFDHVKSQNSVRVAKFSSSGIWGPGASRSLTHYNGFQFNSLRAKSYVEVEPPFPYMAHRARIDDIVKTILPQLATEISSIRVMQMGVGGTVHRHPLKSKMTGGGRNKQTKVRRGVSRAKPRGIVLNKTTTVVAHKPTPNVMPNPKPTTTKPKPIIANPKTTLANPKPTLAKPKPIMAKPKLIMAKPKLIQRKVRHLVKIMHKRN